MNNTMSILYVNLECCNCGVVFAVSNDLNGNWLKTKKSFYCPNGHSQSYTKSTAEKLQEALSEKEAELARLNSKIWNLEHRKAGRPKKYA